MPNVSLVLTVYNEKAHLEESLHSLIGQNYKDTEIIIVDDGSTDESIKIARKYPVKLIKQSHLGLGAARNRGAKEATGKILVFCDADLIYDPDYIRRLINPITNDRAIGTFHQDELVKNPVNFWSRCWQINDHLPLGRKLPLKTPKFSTFFRAIKKDIFQKRRY